MKRSDHVDDMDWIIEKGAAEDAETITGFQLEMALESEGTVLDRERVLCGVSAGLADPAKGIYYLVKTEGGACAGSCFLTKEWSDWNNCWYWWIQSVYVRPEYRRMGAFSALYDSLRASARKEGSTCLRLYVDRGNSRAQQCYRRQGMAGCHYLMYEEKL